MRCLGIPNTAHFANVTQIEDALACKFQKIFRSNRNAKMEAFTFVIIVFTFLSVG